MIKLQLLKRLVISVLLGAMGIQAGMAKAQQHNNKIGFSLDFQGPSNGVGDGFFAIPIDEGSIYTPALPGPPGPNDPASGPLPSPGLMVCANTANCTGSAPRNLGINATSLGYRELDALSFGRDKGDLYFSVDEFATGIFGSPLAPNVFTEGASASGNKEASADIFRYLGFNGETDLPAIIPDDIIGNTAYIDGDGVAPFGGPGLGLIEPNPPTVDSYNGGAGSAPDSKDTGDNLDAFDFVNYDEDVFNGPIYFSLDSAFADPLEDTTLSGPPNTGTAAANGFVGGDILVQSAPNTALGVYISAVDLGLDRVGDPDSDDLDALVLYDALNDGIFDPITDFVEFSVRRDSAVIGSLDSRLGIAIEEGDILTLPTNPGDLPSILIPAEALGLTTVRSGTAVSYGEINPKYGNDVWADDVDALSKKTPEPNAIIGLIFMGALGLGLKRKK